MTYQFFVNVTMYCYIQKIHILYYYMYFWMCNPTEQVSHFYQCWQTQQRYEAGTGLTEKKRRAHVWPISFNTNHARTLGYPERDDTLYTFCQCILYTVSSMFPCVLCRQYYLTCILSNLKELFHVHEVNHRLN